MTIDDNNPYADRFWLAAYPADVPADLPPIEGTLVDVLDATVQAFPTNAALEFFGRETTYEELGRQVALTAEGLRRLGVGRGDRVAIVLPNCPQAVIALYATLRLGAIAVLHNPTYTAPELRTILRDHGARIAVVWSKLADLVAGLAAEDGSALDRVVSVDLIAAMPARQRILLSLPLRQAREGRARLAATPTTPGILPWSHLQSSTPLSSAHDRPRLDDVAVIQYTSGTTGTPNGAMLTHRNLRANQEQVRVWLTGLRPGREVFYAVLPLFHAYGLSLVLTTGTLIGARIVLFPLFDAQMTLTAMRRSRASFLPAVPPIYEALLREARPGDLTGISYAMCGGMSLSARTVDHWMQATGGVILEGYGLSEASPVVTGVPETTEDRRFGTVGVPMSSTLVRVVDPGHPDRAVPLGEPGELLVQGPQVFQGYWGNESATAATLLPDGWLRTGDVVTMAEDGSITIVDRLKDIIITRGFNVSPAEVEAVLVTHSDVDEACVFGLPREDGGEDVCAAVVLREGAGLDPDALRAFARESLAPYKVPRTYLAVDGLPKSIIGKVRRQALRQQLVDSGALDAARR